MHHFTLHKNTDNIVSERYKVLNFKLIWEKAGWGNSVFSGGSRIFRGGTPTPKVGELTNFFDRKLHENERIGTPGGGGASLAPPLDPPMSLSSGDE